MTRLALPRLGRWRPAGGLGLRGYDIRRRDHEGVRVAMPAPGRRKSAGPSRPPPSAVVRITRSAGQMFEVAVAA
jgi:hypothetical protein